MSVLQKMMLLMPHVEFESAELRQRFTNFMESLDKDLDSSGFDTSTFTDDMFESLEECLENLENDVVVQIREATDEEQDEIDEEAEALDAADAAEDAEATAESTTIEVEETTEIVVELEGEGNGKDADEEDFEQELEDEVAEQTRLEEIRAAAEGEISKSTESPPST